VTSERILALDMSTKTGYALLISDGDGIDLGAYGQIPQIHQPDGTYPEVFVDWAYLCFSKIVELIDTLAPTVLVIEETSAGSKAVYTQKILEYCHFLLAKFIKETKIKSIYIMSEQWRREVGCKMSKEESKHNKEVRDYKKKNNTKIAYSESGKRIGRLTRKHVNIRRANEVFGSFFQEPLRKRDEDLCDALLLGFAYHLRRVKNEQR
jgi:ribosomal protein L20A (L18A)